MAQNLGTEVNLFSVGDNVVGNNPPTDINTQGILKGNSDTGFYLKTDNLIKVYFYYEGTGSWQLYSEIAEYEDGCVIPWIQHVEFGQPIAAFFVTLESQQEVRIIARTGNLSVDDNPTDNTFNKDFLILKDEFSTTIQDDDGDLSGAGYTKHIITNLSGNVGDSIDYLINAEITIAMILADSEKIDSTFTYDSSTFNSTITFNLPSGYETKEIVLYFREKSDLPFLNKNYISFEGNSNTEHIAAGYNGLPNHVTVSLWARSTSTSWPRILIERVDPVWSRSPFAIDWNGGAPYASCRVESTSSAYNGVNLSTTGLTNTINDGEWHHIVLRFNGVKLSLYIDGEEKSSKLLSTVTGATGNLWPAGNPNSGVDTSGTVIGKGYHSTQASFQGDMDEVAIWETAITEEAIEEIYNKGLLNKSANLNKLQNESTLPVAWYRMGD